MGGRSSEKLNISPTVDLVMRRLMSVIDKMDEPAIEKIADDQKSNPFQVLIATMLSAQTKDAVTFDASQRLFANVSTPQEMLRLSVRKIEALIFPVSFYRNKARHIKKACRLIVDDFGGHVPTTMSDLLTLPGVGRKTANLTLIIAHQSNKNICVDTHVHRISNRLGWVITSTPEQTEQRLYTVSPRRWWARINLYLVTWGQNVCRPVYPLCNKCVINDLCPRIGVKKVGRG